MEQAARILNGTFTIHSPAGGHRTFQIKTAKAGKLKGSRILALLTGPNNSDDYTGFGFVTDQGISLWSRFRNTGDWAKYAEMLWSLATEGESSRYYALGYRLLASSLCLRCNRKLTTPESLARGIGPECAQIGRG